MFNFAGDGVLKDMVKKVKRDHGHDSKVPSQFADEKAVYEQAIQTKGREQAIHDDAKSIAMIMLTTKGHDPISVMDASTKWTYIKKFHLEYYNSVANLAKRLIQYHSADLKKLVPPVAPKGQAPGGAPPGGDPMGGMGGIPGAAPAPGGPMASTSKMEKEAKLYIYRNDQKAHKIIGTLASEIVAGKQQYLDEEGMPFIMRTAAGEKLIISYYSQAAKAAMALNKELPDKMITEIEKFLSDHNLPDSKELSKATYARIRKVKNFDLLPISLALTSPSNCILLKNSVGTMEPEEVHQLRIKLGGLMVSYMKSLQQALQSESIKFAVLKGYMATSTFPGMVRQSEDDKERETVGDKPVSNVMRVLKSDEVRSSSDVRSLMMSVSTGDEQVAKIAAVRLAELICKHSESIEAVGLTPADIDALGKSKFGGPVQRAINLAKMDAADLVSAYVDGQDDVLTQYLVGSIVSSKKDHDVFSILSAMPEIIMAGGVLHPELMAKLPENDPEAIRVFKQVLQKTHKYRALIEKKLIRFLATTEDIQLERLAYEGRFQIACCYIAAKKAEQGKFENTYWGINPDKAMMQSDYLALAMVAVIAHCDDDKISFPAKTWKYSPLRIQSVAGQTYAKAYMRASRISWDCEPIPTANQILSAPDHPMNLASSLKDIGDLVGLLALLHACGVKYKEGQQEFASTIKFIVNEFEEEGIPDRAYAVMNTLNLNVDDSGSVLGDDAPSYEQLMANLKAGNDIQAAIILGKIFEEDEEAARAILSVCPEPKDKVMFLEMLPLKLATDSQLPSWAKSAITHSFILPNGRMVSGSFGVYKSKGSVFASCRLYAKSNALNVGR